MEEKETYLLKADLSHATMDADVRAQLVDLKRQLKSLLVTVERVLGDEPSVMTRAQRRQQMR